jgi:SAM-dependent methyltransferase
VSHDGRLSIVDDTFDVVVSCHSIEHQIDLVTHLIDVGKILGEGGYYFIVVPDKRYCFDHFLAETTIAEALDGHYRNNKSHSLKSVIEHRALTTHNDFAAHWRGEHGTSRLQSSGMAVLHAAIREYEAAKGAYIDVHAWQFTPTSFRQLFEQLFELNYSSLKPIRVYNTVGNTPEFCAILQKCDHQT